MMATLNGLPSTIKELIEYDPFCGIPPAPAAPGGNPRPVIANSGQARGGKFHYDAIQTIRHEWK
jgi:hypothetical protein